uniref:Receptor protein serine/threonine kinase n=2 Tax=Panagrolaimus sp. PS1159 TaxID=55785 RepID=A0AC35GSY3_9BILA
MDYNRECMAFVAVKVCTNAELDSWINEQDVYAVKIMRQHDNLRISFLHEKRDGKFSKPTIAHRNFIFQNVLLKDNLTSCINDFSLAMKYDGNSISVDELHGQVETGRISFTSFVTNGKGYLEDRRPSSNCDPYVVTAAIASVLLLDKDN